MSKPLWTSDEIARATGGKASTEWTVTGLSIDTRTLQDGDLFIPLKDNLDGHMFIPNALEAGASGVISEVDVHGPHIRVKDSLEALRDLSVAARERSDALRIAVTGSVGKTSVKDALAIMLAKFSVTHKSQKSYNNHWGAPLTLAMMAQNTEYCVLELGMNHAGELSDLSTLVAPNIALITTIGGVHLAHFENVQAIADAKAEIMEGLTADGTLVLNGDNPYSDGIAKTARAKGLRVVTFGADNACDVTIVTSQTHTTGSNTRLRIEDQQYDVTLSVAGAHWVSNGAACMAVAYAAGLDLRKAAMALRSVVPISGRGERHTLSLEGKTFTLVDESYNANPVSMQAAIATTGLMQGRKIAVLGDMGELGADELIFHAELAAPLIEAGFSRVITCGERMRSLRGALPQAARGPWAPNGDVVDEILNSEIEDGDVVLVKGSNAAGLGRLVERLKTKGRA